MTKFLEEASNDKNIDQSMKDMINAGIPKLLKVTLNNGCRVFFFCISGHDNVFNVFRLNHEPI